MKSNISIKQFIRTHPNVINFSLVIVSTLFTIALIESGFRLFVHLKYPYIYTEISSFLQRVKMDETKMLYQPHPYLVYSRTDTVYDENGIHIGKRYYTFEKPENVIRIACIGGSTTQNAHPLLMKEYLERDFNGQQFEVMDFGCASWTSQESLINYIIRIQDFQPDYLVIHLAVNDIMPQIYKDFQPDYSHFRKVWGDQTGMVLHFLARYSFAVNSILYFKGITPFDIRNYVCHQLPLLDLNSNPPNERLNTFKRNIETIVTLAQANQTKVMIAPVSYHPTKMSNVEIPIVEKLFDYQIHYSKEHNLPCVDTRWFYHQNQDWFVDSVHLNVSGLFLNTYLFSTVIRDNLRGFSDIVDANGNSKQSKIQLYNEEWHPLRKITLKWSFDIPSTTSYHIYFRDESSGENYYLARTKNADTNSIHWYKNNPEINVEFQNGPELGKRYWFTVYAISGEPPFSNVSHQSSKNMFKVDDRIVFQQSTINLN